MASIYGLVTDTKKYGSGSLYSPYNTSTTKRFVINAVTPAPGGGDFAIGANEDFYISVWIKYGNLNVSTLGARYPIIQYGNGTTGWEICVLIQQVGDAYTALPYFRYDGRNLTTNFNGSNGDLIDPSGSDFDSYVIYRTAGVIHFEFTKNGNKTFVNSLGYKADSTYAQATYTSAIAQGVAGGITLGSTQPIVIGQTNPNGAWIDELFFAKNITQVYNLNTDSSINDGGRATTKFLYHFDGNYSDTTTGPASGITEQGQAALVSNTGNLVINARSILADHPVLNPTEALIHFESSTLADAMYSGVPTWHSGYPTNLPPNIVTGKFSQGIETGGGGTAGSNYWSETTNIDLTDGSNFVFDFWYKDDGDYSGYGQAETVIAAISGIQINRYSTTWHSHGNDWGLAEGTIYVQYGTNTITTIPSQYVSNANTGISVFKHYLVSRVGTTCRLFVNGVIALTWTDSLPNLSKKTIIIGAQGGNIGVQDEFRLKKGVTVTANFTPPTSAYTETYYSVAKSVTSDVTSRFTLSTSAQKTKVSSAVLQPAFTLTADVIRTKFVSASITARATVTATASNRTRQQSAALQPRFALTANVMRVIVTSAALQSVSTVTTQAKQYKGTRASVTSTSTLVPNAIKTSVARSNLTAFFTEVTTDIGTKRTGANLTLAFSQQTNNLRLRNNLITATATSTITTNARKTTKTQAQLTSTSTVSTNNTRIRNMNAALQAGAFEVTIDRKITSTLANLQARFTISATCYILEYSRTVLNSNFALIVTPQATHRYQANLTDNRSQLTANGGYVRGAFVHLQVSAFELATGSKFTLEPRLQKIIEQETRIYLVKPEDRRLEIYSDGILKIAPETRLLQVKQQDPVNTIPGIKL